MRDHRVFVSFAAKALLFVVFGFRTNVVYADLPTAEITLTYGPSEESSTDVDGRQSTTLLATQASFGIYPPQQKQAVKMEDYPYTLQPVFSPEEDPLLCNTDEEMANANANDVPTYDSSFVMLVPRGSCTFEQKALNAQNRYNVGAVIVYGSLSSRYGYNETTQEIIYPSDKNDYDCSYGEGSVPSNQLIFNPTYDPSNDAVVNNQCESGENHQQCASHKCLITSPPDETGYSKVCCAWDLHIWLYQDPTVPANTTETTVAIPAMYITMDQIDQVKDIMSNGQNVLLSMYSRNRPETNLSGGFIWALGVFTAFLASYLSAKDIRMRVKRMTGHALIPGRNTQESVGIKINENANIIMRRSNSPSRTNTSSHYNREELSSREESYMEDEETLELTMAHAAMFLVWSSFSLFILFYFKIYNVVKILYAFGCAGALTQVMITPTLRFLPLGKWTSNEIFFTTSFLEIGELSYLDFASTLTGYTIGLIWLILSFTERHAEQNSFFWIVQDLMGISICVMFLSVLKVNNLKIASALLVSAFFYDIFFVFITPFLFSGKSIMVTVATSGGPPTADPLWCEKYPSDSGCQGGDPLPMLLTVPRLFDYQGGASLLGLGDIVLPGLVLSFASRLDASKKLLATMGRGRSPTGFFNSYFGPIVIAYAIGLMMANVAVVLMKMGQPALLYLVPMCLGSLFFVGRRNGEVMELWEGPQALKTVERMLREIETYGESNIEGNISLTRVGDENVSEAEGGSFT